MAAAAREGRDKLTILLPDEVAVFGLWIEQLVAESTGKHGKGILPVIDERPGSATFGDDRLVVAYGDHLDVPELTAAGIPVVRLGWAGRGQLPAEVARWEFATAVAGALLELNPFDQPDVAAAKAATTHVLATGGDLPDLMTRARCSARSRPATTSRCSATSPPGRTTRPPCRPPPGGCGSGTGSR
jgi:hypothetical protein